MVVVVIAAIAAATIRDEPQPATPPEPPEREPAPAPVAAPDPPPVPTYDPEPSELAFPPAEPLPPSPSPSLPPEPVRWPDLEPGAPDDAAPVTDGTPDDRSLGRRLRSLGLLGVTVVVLGTGAAALLGAVVVVGYRLLDGALG